MRYYKERARGTYNYFSVGEEGADVCCVAGQDGIPFRGKNSCGGRVAAGQNICVLEYLFFEDVGMGVGLRRGDIWRRDESPRLERWGVIGW